MHLSFVQEEPLPETHRNLNASVYMLPVVGGGGIPLKMSPCLGFGFSFRCFGQSDSLWSPQLNSGFAKPRLHLLQHTTHMVVCQNWGNLIETGEYDNPDCWDPQNGTPNSGKLPYSSC